MKQSRIMKSKRTPIYVTDLQANDKIKFYSVHQAARAISFSHVTILNYLKSGKILQARYIFLKVVKKK